MSSLPLTALASRGGFVADPRFAAARPRQASPVAASDPKAEAWADGYAQGRAEAEEEAAIALAAERDGLSALATSFVKLDAAHEEELRQRLFATVEALLETAIGPFALDREAFADRIVKAASMLARADDARVLRLHPEDAVWVAPQIPEGLEVVPDPALERGALRLEGDAGGVEDGPAHWRRAIAEALAQC